MPGKLFLYSHLFGTMGFKEQEGEIQDGQDARTGFPVVLVPFNFLARVHDEATTSDDGGDTGNQFYIAAGANEHGEKANHQKACYKEGPGRDSNRTPDPGAARTDAEPADSDRRSKTGER